MTRENAILCLKGIKNYGRDTFTEQGDWQKSLDMAIDALKAEPKHGQWIKMSDADGIYYACSECGNDLPRVINSFDPQIDLFPKLKCIDKTTYCPNCGARMEAEDNG